MKMPIDLMPAAGWCKTVVQVEKLAKIPVISHIVMGSFTVAPREGNTGGTNFVTLEDGTSFNSLGLPNGGLRFMRDYLWEMVEIARSANKTAVVSIASDSPDEYAELAFHAFEFGTDIVEINLGCPNKFGDGGEQKRIASYNRVLVHDILKKCGLVYKSAYRPFWIKLSPYADPEERVSITECIKALHTTHQLNVHRVTLCNTFPNCIPRDEKGNKLINAENTKGRAGMAGTGLRHIAMANAEHFRELLPKEIGINYAGGISSGADLAAARRIGCAGAQIGTAFFNGENFRIFEHVMTEFVNTPEVA